MNADELRPILAGYRTQVEKAWSEDTSHPDYKGAAGSPVGQSGVTSVWLQERLSEDHGIDARCVLGSLYNTDRLLDSRHVWLHTGELLVDLTADQYGEAPVICETDVRPRLHYIPRRSLILTKKDPVLSRLALLKAAL